MSAVERRRRERTARSQAILAAATEVFARHGIEGATMEMVAREAEVAVGTIYLYFVSREELYLSLLAAHFQRLRERYREIKARRLDPLDEIRTMVRAYFEFLKESRGLFVHQMSGSHERLSQRLKHRAEFDRHIQVTALVRELFSLWQATVSRVYRSGLIRQGPGPARTAALFWATLNGAFMLAGNPTFRNVIGVSSDNFAGEILDLQLGLAGDATGPGAAADGGGRRGLEQAKIRRSERRQEIGA